MIGAKDDCSVGLSCERVLAVLVKCKSLDKVLTYYPQLPIT